ncbi:hypothetical protein M3Y99_00147700 [Aphelenchoides fujianensis]|nr:hypothetical protein M3Y99_01182200 [Aphelenchoides fujianensis]KAI6243234.1 hypothetical protein M3Y99_00147700 [Aphelenchoides fujianensis]
MEVLLFDQQQYDLLYNCSFYSIESIPLEKRQHRVFGALLIVAYAICTSTYAACLYAMWRTKLRARASYRLMMLLAVIHITGLQACGLVTGILAIEGAVFCSHPTLIYVVGAVGMGTWGASTMTSMLLGINRCFELASGRWAAAAFGGWRIAFWLALPIGYFLFLFIFTPPPLFSGVLVAWSFNPHAAFFDDFEARRYSSTAHSANNLVVCSCESVIYGFLLAAYIYIQVIAIGVIHFVASASYLLLQFVPMTFGGSLTASFFYFLSQGAPPLIYLAVNRTIRSVLLKDRCSETAASQTTPSRSRPSIRFERRPSALAESSLRYVQ